jgi:GT2 family glycosyltransferase
VATDTYEHNWTTNEVGSGEYTYGKIFWIDSDIEWSVEDFARILASPFDVIGGMYATAPDGTVAVARFDEKRRPKKTNEIDFFMNEEMTEVFGLGFGFLAVKSGVFESMDRPWFKIEQMQWDEVPFTVNVGEDYSWCMNARRNGYKIWVDPGVKVKHHKETTYYLP